MKPLEEAFASQGFRRVILPGIIATVGFHPVVRIYVDIAARSYGITPPVLVVVQIVFWGLLISSATTWIYYVYEGFRLPWLTVLARKANERRLRQIQATIASQLQDRNFDQLAPTEQDRVSKAYEMLLDYPKLGQANEATFVVERPTRLGNIIASYELYPESRYGFDGVFYWFHLLAIAPADLRKEFTEQYAFAQTLVITSFTGAVVALLHIAISLSLLFGRLFDITGLPTLPASVSGIAAVALLGFGAGVSWLFYRLALPEQREVGNIFRAIVDLTLEPFLKWVRSVQIPPDGDITVKAATVQEYLVALRIPHGL